MPAPSRPSDELVRIDRIAAGGDGVGRLADGRVVFVPRTAPGDLIECRITRTAARFARGRMARLVEPGPGRVEPPCPHYRDDECGGCQLQHLTPLAQAEVRRAVVGDALRRIAKVEVADPPMTNAAVEWGYRAKITLTRGPSGAIGFHRVEQPGQIVPIERCPIAAPALNALWARVRSVASLPSNLERVVLRLDRTGGEHLVIETGDGRAWDEGKALHGAAQGAAALTVWWRPPGAAARVVAGPDSAFPALAFEQVNPTMGDRVRAHAVAALGDVIGRRVWDLYSGIGETSTLLAERGAAQVISVERDREAMAEAGRRQAGHGRRIERVVGLAERVVGSLGPPDLVIANPPRTGLADPVVAEIGRRAPERIVYVSCDPATLARDVGRLTARSELGGYRLGPVAAFDLFPQTAHVETVAVLERA